MDKAEEREKRQQKALRKSAIISNGECTHQRKYKLVAEYTLRDTSKPIGVSAFRLTQTLPEMFKSSLPIVEGLEEVMVKAPGAPG